MDDIRYALFDANIIIDFREIERSNLIYSICTKKNWIILMSEEVLKEVRWKDPWIENGIRMGDIEIKKSGSRRFEQLRAQFSIGKGETEIIALVEECLDKSYKPYVIITQDKKPSGIATELGMKSYNICDFLFLGYKNDVISKQEYLSILKQWRSFKIINLEYDHYKSKVN